MKKRILSVILCLILCASLVPATAFAIEAIEDINLTVAAPVAGETWDSSDELVRIYGRGYELYSFSGYSTDDNEGEENEDEFRLGEEYYAIFYLKASDGYLFADDAMLTAEVNSGFGTVKSVEVHNSGIGEPGEYVEVVVYFTPARYDMGTVYVVAAPPEAGKTPNYAASPESEHYHIARDSVRWFELSEDKLVHHLMEEGDVFKPGRTYMIHVGVVLDSAEYMFTDKTTGVMNNVECMFSGHYGTEGSVFAEFVCPAGPADNIIYDVTVNVQAPKVGSGASLLGFTPEGEHYTATNVNWFCDEDNRSLKAGDKFEAGKTYILDITVEAEDGYEFAENNALNASLNGGPVQIMKYGENAMLKRYFTIPEIVIERVEIPETGIAYENVSKINVDGQVKELKAYMLKAANGYGTNYMRLRDIADLLNGTNAQFDIVWTKEFGTNCYSHTPYMHPNGTEGNIPFHGNQTYTVNHADTYVDGVATSITSFFIKDANGGGHTFLQLRDFGKAFGFNVGYSDERGVFVETDRPYTDMD